MGVPEAWDKSHVDRMLVVARRVHTTTPTAGRRHRTLLEGLCELTGATAGVLVIGAAPGSDRRRGSAARPAAATYVVTPPAGSRPTGSARVGRPIAYPPAPDGEQPDPAAQKLLRRVQRRAAPATLTATRQELLDDDAWYAHPHVAATRRSAGFDHGLYSVHLPATGRAALVCLSRPVGHPRPFSVLDRDTVDLLHRHAAWTYADDATPASLAALDLSPRERQTLAKLLAGRGEKQIAAEMQLSPNTVHHYVKSLYKHFGVSSRAELLARWLDRIATETSGRT